MRGRQAGRWLLRFGRAVVLTLVVVVVLSVAVVKARNWRVDRAIDRFQAAPSQKRANELIKLIAGRAVTRGQGQRILALLLRPQVITRAAYPAGQPAKVSITRRWDIEIPQGEVLLQQFVWTGGRWIDAGGDRHRRLPPILDGWVQPLEPGTYHAQIHTECRIKLPARRSTLWDRLNAQLPSRLSRLLGWPRSRPQMGREVSYECGFMTPFDINIAEEGQAQRLELLAGPEVDELMRGAVTVKTSAGRRGYRGPTIIVIRPLPIAVAFELSLRLADGRELPAGAGRQPQRIRFLPAGDYGWDYVVDVGCFGLEEPGEYKGTLILKPDPDYAYEDPAIKSIWNKTLEFPISFRVYLRPQVQGREQGYYNGLP
jgi:hypothetical protein